MTADRKFDRERELRNVQLGQEFSPFSSEIGYGGGSTSPLIRLFDGSEHVGDMVVTLERDPKYGGIDIPEDLAILTDGDKVTLEQFGRQIVVLQTSLVYTTSLTDDDDPYKCSISVGDVLLHGVDETDIVEEISQFTRWRSPNTHRSQIVSLNFFDKDLLKKVKCKVEK